MRKVNFSQVYTLLWSLSLSTRNQIKKKIAKGNAGNRMAFPFQRKFITMTNLSVTRTSTADLYGKIAIK